MANLAELLLGCLDAAGARTVAEVGAYAGGLTAVLAQWAQGAGATVLAIDPAPQDELVALAKENPRVELMRRTSLDALPEMDVPDALVIDGDHNHWTVSEELRLIAERAGGGRLPLLLFHDVCWPHGRRDDYFDPEAVPADHRQPLVGDGAGIRPGDPGSGPGGLPYPRSAAREGGAGNGVRTAIEDFAAKDSALRFAVVPAFFGFGALWHEGAPWAGEVAAVLEPWDRHPLLERLEDNRVHHIAESHGRMTELWAARERLAGQEAVLRRMLDSSAFTVAERLSRLRARAGVATDQSVVSRDEIRRALGDD